MFFLARSNFCRLARSSTRNLGIRISVEFSICHQVCLNIFAITNIEFRAEYMSFSSLSRKNPQVRHHLSHFPNGFLHIDVFHPGFTTAEIFRDFLHNTFPAHSIFNSTQSKYVLVIFFEWVHHMSSGKYVCTCVTVALYMIFLILVSLQEYTMFDFPVTLN